MTPPPGARLPLTALLGPLSPGIVALVGAGGKTSLMFALANALASGGRRVICTTSTRIRPPLSSQCAEILLTGSRNADDLPVRALAEALARARIVTVAARSLREGAQDGAKWEGLATEAIDRLAAAFPDVFVLVEADGAAMRPLKAPAQHEPAVPSAAICCVAVLGLDGLGRPLDEIVVHRAVLAARLAGQAEGTPVTLATLECLVLHPEGLFRSCPPGCRRVVLYNKADSDPFSVRQAGGSPPPEAEDKSLPAWYTGSVREGWCRRREGLSARGKGAAAELKAAVKEDGRS